MPHRFDSPASAAGTPMCGLGWRPGPRSLSSHVRACVVCALGDGGVGWVTQESDGGVVARVVVMSVGVSGEALAAHAVQ